MVEVHTTNPHRGGALLNFWCHPHFLHWMVFCVIVLPARRTLGSLVPWWWLSNLSWAGVRLEEGLRHRFRNLERRRLALRCQAGEGGAEVRVRLDKVVLRSATPTVTGPSSKANKIKRSLGTRSKA